MKHAIRHIHFVGIGGAGMSGIAEVLLNMGYVISGSDLSDGVVLQRLQGLGVKTCVGHRAENILGADAVVTSTAVKADNPEVVAAHGKLIPVVPRAVMLAELMRLKRGVAIAGTHGKTTTTSLVASVLAQAGLDPTFVIGGRLNSAGANAKLGSGDYIVVEADESDASFLNLMPVMSVVTNIDADHMETYGHDFGRLKGAFVEFLHRMPFYGAAILCTDDEAVRSILPDVSRPITSYGLGEQAQVRAHDVRAVGSRMQCRVTRSNGITLPDLQIDLNLPGEHNVRNALAAIAVAVELGVPDAAVQQALAEFKGVGRRFQRHGDWPAKGGGRFTLIEDYGHHPVELGVTLAAARGAFPGRRLVLAFQPHRYTRTRDCFEDFVRVLRQADAVWLAEVYAAGEAPIVGADGRALARALRLAGQDDMLFVPTLDEMTQTVLQQARDGDVVMCMGAGSIGQVPAKVLQQLEGQA
ncbi:MAG: UDP-N-acetylmuramate--L-alanine ligase [Burkholderiaceae bacterium]|jgi:UDP-N-acetylmuramate--alanine ligase|nr:UDP-N-acetylmuramate--L-alanine ligase [Burkholderiaceae bacterium]